jgi:hypothetical protein
MGGSRSGSTCTTASEIAAVDRVRGGDPGRPRVTANATSATVTSRASPAAIRAFRGGPSRPTPGWIVARRSAASAAGSGRPRSRSSTPVTAKTCHVPGTPFSSCAEKSSNPKPEPVTSSFVVEVTRISPAFARDITRAPITTAIPWVLPSCDSVCPVWIPERISIPSVRTSSASVAAQRIALSGCVNVAKNPSPA